MDVVTAVTSFGNTQLPCLAWYQHRSSWAFMTGRSPAMHRHSDHCRKFKRQVSSLDSQRFVSAAERRFCCFQTLHVLRSMASWTGLIHEMFRLERMLRRRLAVPFGCFSYSNATGACPCSFNIHKRMERSHFSSQWIIHACREPEKMAMFWIGIKEFLFVTFFGNLCGAIGRGLYVLEVHASYLRLVWLFKRLVVSYVGGRPQIHRFQPPRRCRC
jgi:hypothetical protein